MKILHISLLLALPLAASAAGPLSARGSFLDLAPTPPMGWNSYNNFGSSVTEDEVVSNATYMKENLIAHGWRYVVVDYRWSDPTAADYNSNGIGGPLVADSFGRLLPAPNRFPSATDGKGFKPLGEKIHGMGLKFGIHVMRGIPRQSAKANTPIEGSAFTATDAVNDKSTCWWCLDMYGVLPNAAGQAWYDSIFRLYASWGVDYVKVDDLSAPYHREEVEMVRKAIDKCGRPMVLSTSPGGTPFGVANHVAQHANMWRLAADFWDSWGALSAAFSLADQWTSFRGPGNWPDLDMLQLGRIGTRCHRGARQTLFTPEEQITHMSLWSIARSPLMFGGDLTKNDEWTKSLITNDEVLAVNQHSQNNRQLWRKPSGHVAWIADVPNSTDKYVGLFRLDSAPDLEHPKWKSPLVNRETPGHAVPVEVNIEGAKKLFLVVDDGGDGREADSANWIEPVLEGPAGTRKLTDIRWKSASAGSGKVRINQNGAEGPLRVNGADIPFGIGTHAASVIEYELPPGYTRFQAQAGLDNPGTSKKKGASVRFYVDTKQEVVAADSQLTIAFKDLNLGSHCKVRDLWSQKDLGAYDEAFTATIPLHGAGLYRVSGLQEKH